jgi:SecD/SecF fusion protein
MLNREKTITFGNRITENLFKNINVDFVRIRKYGYIVSIVSIIVGVVSIATIGFDYGVDFKGGYSYVVRFDKDVSTNQITEQLRKQLGGSPEVKTYGPNNQVKITTDYMIDDQTVGAQDRVEAIIKTSLTQLQGSKFEILSREKVGATIADDLKKGSILAVFYSLIGIFIYIFFRFKKWQFGLAGVICLFHDIFLILTVFSLFRYILPFSLALDQSIIAALLTVIGYDINDTVVIYDRIREKMSLNKRKPIYDTINEAINETISRTIITSFTVFIVLIVLFIFGGEIIRGFSFALLIGIALGSLSSIFVATPLVIEFSRKKWLKEHMIEGQE